MFKDLTMYNVNFDAEATLYWHGDYTESPLSKHILEESSSEHTA